MASMQTLSFAATPIYQDLHEKGEKMVEEMLFHMIDERGSLYFSVWLSQRKPEKWQERCFYETSSFSIFSRTMRFCCPYCI